MSRNAIGSVTPAQSSDTEIQTEEESPHSPSWQDRIKDNFGITYFSFLNGPGLHPDSFAYSPNQLGKPGNDGINILNQISLRYKFSNNLALDFQSRFYLIINNHTKNPDFQYFRWETPRIGISGELLKGEEWSLTGAVNTDFPYFLPSPFTGYQAQQRTAALTPGMFASFKYRAHGSRWSVFSVVSPRFFIYANRDAGEPQLTSAGFEARNKAEFILGLQPKLNYEVSDKISISVGTAIDYRKQVLSGWNPFSASLVMNGQSKSWRLAALPINIGTTFNITSELNVFPFVSFYPIAAQRYDSNTLKQAGFLESASMGMWVSGTLF